MRKRWGAILAAVAAIGIISPPARAQSVSETVDAIDHARVTTRILYVTAHPDDERSSVLTYLSKGLGDEVALCSTTRGEGGQNAIGPELGPALEILRTNELYRATQAYGVKLFFTRAPDFGYSKSAEETLRIWGDGPKEDLVRIIRTFRPNIVINQWGDVHSGHGQHQATGIIVPQAVAAAADLNAYPDQFKQGLWIWHVSRVLQYVGAGPDQAGSIQLPVGEISPLWGESYSDLGLIGFANHRSQGITRILDSSFFRRPVYLRVAQGEPITQADLAQSLFSLSTGGPNDVAAMLGTAAGALATARLSALRLDWPATVKFLAVAGTSIDKALQDAQAVPAMTDRNLLWELKHEREKIDAALVAAAALRMNPEADKADLVAGEGFGVHVDWQARTDDGVQFSQPSLNVPQGWTASREEQKRRENEPPASGVSFRVEIPAGATTPESPDKNILPWAPPLVEAEMAGTVDGYTFSAEEPVISKDYTSTEVETMPLELIPAVTLSVDPEQVMLPQNRATKAFQLLMRVRYHGTTKAHVEVGLDLPEGWSADSIAPLEFSEPGDRLVRFTVTPPANSAEGAYELKPFAKLGEETFHTSYEALPDLPSRHVSGPAFSVAHVLDLTIPEHLRVGYIAAGIDPVPQSLQQLGIDVDMLDEAALSFGDLSRYNAIVVGIRAYELRPDVMRNNQRLLDYIEHGGTLVVQYERDFAWNRLLPAPYPAKMDQPAERITDENSPVKFLDPSSPLLNYPNRITQDDFNGWIQERGLYFLAQQIDSHYHAVLAMHDPGETDATGGLVYAPYGKGIYIYTGLAFFRQLPGGVPGAYRLFVNLLSASQAAH